MSFPPLCVLLPFLYDVSGAAGLGFHFLMRVSGEQQYGAGHGGQNVRAYGKHSFLGGFHLFKYKSKPPNLEVKAGLVVAGGA